jgi:hypothetical protein
VGCDDPVPFLGANFSHPRNEYNVDHTYPKPYYSFSRASITLK